MRNTESYRIEDLSAPRPFSLMLVNGTCACSVEFVEPTMGGERPQNQITAKLIKVSFSQVLRLSLPKVSYRVSTGDGRT